MDGVVHQINVSGGGVPKLPVPAATVTEFGVAGDAHADPSHGPDKALCLYALEVIEGFAAEGHPIHAGSVGENGTTRGLDWSRIAPGTRLRLGDEVRIEIVDYTTPCKKQTRWFLDGDISRLNQRVSPGQSRVNAKVLQGGTLAAGDPITVDTFAARPDGRPLG